MSMKNGLLSFGGAELSTLGAPCGKPPRPLSSLFGHIRRSSRRDNTSTSQAFSDNSLSRSISNGAGGNFLEGPQRSEDSRGKGSEHSGSDEADSVRVSMDKSLEEYVRQAIKRAASMAAERDLERGR